MGRRMLPKRSTSRKGASTVTAVTRRGRRSGQRPTSCWLTRISTAASPSSASSVAPVVCARNQAPVSARSEPTRAGGTPGWRMSPDPGRWPRPAGRIPPPAPVEIGEDLGPQEPRARLRVGGSEVEDAASRHAQLRELPERGLAREARLALVEGLGQGPLDLRLEDRQAHDAGCGQRSRQRADQGEPEHVAPLPARSGLEERRGPEGAEDHEREDEVLLGEGVVVPAPQEGQHRRAVACRRGGRARRARG